MTVRSRTEPVIRQATPDDAEAVASVLNAVILEGEYTALTHPFTVDEERAFIEGLCDRSALFVAEMEQGIAGIQSIEPDAAARYTDSMQHVATVGTWMHVGFRGRGIGRLLAEASFAFAQAQDYKKIAIQVLADNQRALRFYGNLGFERVGIARRHVRLKGRFRDVLYLERLFQESAPQNGADCRQGWLGGNRRPQRDLAVAFGVSLARTPAATASGPGSRSR